MSSKFSSEYLGAWRVSRLRSPQSFYGFLFDKFTSVDAFSGVPLKDDALVEERKTSNELINSGHDPALVGQIEKLLHKGEFKRRQAPPLLKVSSEAFGSGWRVPIAAT